MEGERVDIGGWCTLIHADCMDVMDELAGYKPDALVTDPPYAIPTAVAQGRELHRSVGDLSIVEAGLRAYFEPLSEMLPSHGRIFVFADGSSYPVVFRVFYAKWQTALLVWNKGRIGMGREFRKSHELILHGWRRGTPIASSEWSDVLNAPPVSERLHPAEKPVALVEQLIAACDGVVVDPFMGSGSAAVACWKAGLRFVGVEIDRRWFDVAVERIKRQTGNGPLFERVAPTQQAMDV